MRHRLSAAITSLLVATSMFGVALPQVAHAVVAPRKVTIIVGPVGTLSSNYRSRGDHLADVATAAGAVVTKVYTPNATWANVKAAVNGANVIIYIGHGNGFPNPYSSTLGPERVDGWGLNRIAGIDAADPTGDGDSWSTNLVYCGEAALEGKPLPAGSPQATYCTGGKITPAPGFVMIYSNACYSPGAGETEETTPTGESTAVSRVANYSRPVLALGAGAYFASDIGSDSVLDAVLRNPDLGFGDIFTLGNGFSQVALRTFAHPTSPGDQVWVQKTSNHGGLASYWYAFGGDPTETPNGGHVAPLVDIIRPYPVTRSPGSGATGVSMIGPLVVSFSEPVTGVDASSVRLRDTVTTALVSGQVTFDPATATATWRPLVPLYPGRLYRAELTSTIADAVGNKLAYTQWWYTARSQELLTNPVRKLQIAPGYYSAAKFNAGWGIIGLNQQTLAAPVTVLTSQRRSIPGQTGAWYYVSAGTFAGYWLRDSAGLVLVLP